MVMGSPLFPDVCNIYIDNLDYKAIDHFAGKTKLKKKYMLIYVDDISMIWSNTVSITEYFSHFNQQSENIKLKN